MKKIMIKMEVINKNTPYIFKGIGKIKNNNLLFSDDNYLYDFDVKNHILVKSKKNEKMIIDFNNKKISIVMDDVDLDFNIEIIKEYNKENIYNCVYKLDLDNIEFNIKYSEV